MSQIIPDPQQEIVKWRIQVFKEHNRNVTLRTLVSEARCIMELMSRHPLTAVWAREWLARANEQLEERPR